MILTLGIGPNVAIFSIVYATFFAPMPYPDPDELVALWTLVKGERAPMPVDEYLLLKAQNKSFSYLGFGSWSVEPRITGSDHIPEEISGMAMTPGQYTRGLGLRMALGRDFLPSEGTPGNDHEVIITHKLWQERYRADPAIIGKTIMVNDQPHNIVGVVAAGMGDRIPMQFIVPAAFRPEGHNTGQWGGAMGRLKPGVNLAQAQAELSVLDGAYVTSHSREVPKSGWSIKAEPLHNTYLDKKLATNLWMLLAAVGFVLLIACSNLANLLLARGSSRQQEIAVRGAMGASRRTIFAQLILESLILSVTGGIFGIALGWAMMKVAIVLLPADFGLQSEALVEFNIPVLCFALASTLFAGVLSGCVPAWSSAKLNLSEMLKKGAHSIKGRGRPRTQAILVVAEFALALTLLSGAGMTLHSFWNLAHIDVGARTDHILTSYLRQSRNALENPDQVSAELHATLTKISSLPSVLDVAFASTLPLQGHDNFAFKIAGKPTNNNDKPIADLEVVTPSYFDTFGVQLIRGRLLNDSDTLHAPNSVVVSQGFVHRYLQGADPLDQRLLFTLTPPGQKEKTETAWQIVGVFRGVINGDHLTEAPAPEMFVPLWQLPSWHVQLAVRTSSDPALVTRSVRAAVAETMPGATLVDIQNLQQLLDQELSADRFGSILFGGFATLALLLAGLGIYGVMSFVVAQRTNEIGIRMALGAKRSSVIRLILGDGMKLALGGVAIGIGGVFVLGRVMHSVLYGVRTVDAVSFIVVATVLLAVAFLASYLPARRSAKVDPMLILRSE